jgi:hypothetical protein
MDETTELYPPKPDWPSLDDTRPVKPEYGPIAKFLSDSGLALVLVVIKNA